MDSQSNRSSEGYSYPSATKFNFRELGVIAIFSLFLLLIMLIPFMVNWISSLGGLNLDTYKELPQAVRPESLMPDLTRAISTEIGSDTATALYPGNCKAVVSQFADHAAAVNAWENNSDGASSSGSGQYLRRGTRAEQQFVEWVNGPYLLGLFAPDKAQLEQMIRLSDYIDLPGEPGYGAGNRPFFARLIMDYPLIFAIGLDLLILLFLWAIFAFGIKLATRKPPRGAPRISREGLRDQLLALNSDDCEFLIEEVAPYHLVGRWKFEVPHYRSLLGDHGMTEAYQLDLYINPDGPVGALETRGSISWDTSVAPPQAQIRWNYFRGIVLFEVSTSKVWTLDPADLKFKQVVDFNFDVRRFRVPIVSLVTGNGWRFKPIIFRPLLWRG